VLDWARESFGARFVLAEGVMHVEQPPESIE
jgi:chaperone required for assembly of F1-ATPase